MIQHPMEILQNAWRIGLTEFIAIDPVGEKSHLTSLFQVIANIRYHHLLREGKNESFVRRVYDDIRSIPDFYTKVMSAATTFNLTLGDMNGSIDYFCEHLELYSDKSNVVDNMTLSRKAPTEALKTILQQNQWLLMLLVGSVSETVSVAVVMETGRKTA